MEKFFFAEVKLLFMIGLKAANKGSWAKTHYVSSALASEKLQGG